MCVKVWSIYGKSSRSGVGWSEALVVAVFPSEKVGERNKIRCGDRFGGNCCVVGRGTTWDPHCVGGVPMSTEGGGRREGGVQFSTNGTVRRL